jgi:glycosyltransferase involved in cell wall biosynthesis
MTREVNETSPTEAAAPSECRACILVPTYNNRDTVADVVGRCIALGLPVLVVDDGSTDGSGREASRAGAEVVTHPANLGKGSALLTGWAAAAERGFSHAVTVDADAQHPPEEIPALLEVMHAEPDALVVGNRDMQSENVPRSSRIGRATSDFMLWVAASHELAGERPDSQCGFRIYPLRHVLALGMTGRRYEFEMEILVRTAWHGVPIRARNVRVHYPSPEERVSHFHKWKDNARIVGIYTRLLLTRLVWPLTRPRRRLVPPR